MTVPIRGPSQVVGFSTPWRFDGSGYRHVVVLKLTADLVPDGVARLIEPDPPNGDVDLGRSLVYPSDHSLPKR